MGVTHIMLFLLAVAASIAAAQEMPPDLAALASRALLNGPVASWCRAEFRSGNPGAFAVGVTSAGGGGRYVALDADGSVTELGTFKRNADLSCYSRAQAEKLAITIRQSDTIQGHIAPRWNTTVVCGFIDDTAAVCWQYSPVDRTFLEVGEWVT
ncbi:MAG: hypothetical protein ACRD1Q_07530 [Vicinamibacterales bacterium]